MQCSSVTANEKYPFSASTGKIQAGYRYEVSLRPDVVSVRGKFQIESLSGSKGFHPSSGFLRKAGEGHPHLFRVGVSSSFGSGSLESSFPYACRSRRHERCLASDSPPVASVWPVKRPV
jgi:hypothetical protein